MTFNDYCISKKIDPVQFEAGNPTLWNELKVVFEQMHPTSFTVQKKFLINSTRRLYTLIETETLVEKEKTASVPKVKIPGMKPSIPNVSKPAIPKPSVSSLKPKITSSVKPEEATIPKPSILKPKIGGSTSSSVASKPAALKPKIGGSTGAALQPKIPSAPKTNEVKATPNALKPKIGIPKKKEDDSTIPTEPKKPSALKPIIRPKKTE